MRAAHKYYSDKGVREICHAAKEMDPQAISVMAQELKGLIKDKNALLIPIPSHCGYATYTLEIVKQMGVPFIDILKCRKRESLYKQKLKGIKTSVEDLGFYTIDIIPTNKNIYFIDNVYATGLTAKAAQEIFSKGEVVVYAYDETI